MPTRLPATVIAFIVITTLAWQAGAGGELVKFPENYAEGVRYTTVERFDIKEELVTTRAAIDAPKADQPLPSGAVLTLVDYRDGKLSRYVVMEKRTGWGADYPPDKRNGEWEFQWFNRDKSVKADDHLDRCFSCHKSREGHDFVWTLDQMKSASREGKDLRAQGSAPLQGRYSPFPAAYERNWSRPLP
jgi:Cytochrome P460